MAGAGLFTVAYLATRGYISDGEIVSIMTAIFTSTIAVHTIDKTEPKNGNGKTNDSADSNPD